MKNVLFVPGFKETTTTRDYKKVIKTVESKGYKVEFVPISWNRTSTIDSWVSELEKKYRSYDPQKTILAGFSFGAVTAFIIASKSNPYALWVFSLSAAFAEDIPKLKKSHVKIIGKKRIQEFSKYSFKELAKKITCKTLIFVGEKEARYYPPLMNRAKKAEELVSNSSLIFIPTADHDITEENYLDAIQKTI